MRFKFFPLWLALAGCAQTPSEAVKFVQADISPDQYDRDMDACLQGAKQSVTSGTIINGTGGISTSTAFSHTLIVSCMKARGYRAITVAGKDLPSNATVVKIIE